MGSAAEKAADGGKVDKGARQRSLIGLIDDEPDLVAMSRSCLERDGFRVVDALDARSGLAAVRRESVDLIVVDLGLPDGNGLDGTVALNDRAAGAGPRARPEAT